MRLLALVGILAGCTQAPGALGAGRADEATGGSGGGVGEPLGTGVGVGGSIVVGDGPALDLPEVPPATPCTELEAQGLLCRDGWCWELPSPQGETLHAVWSDGADRQVAVGERGTILAWDGQRWSYEESGTPVTLREIDGPSSGPGWIAGDQATLLRRDADGWSAVPTGAEAITALWVEPGGAAWVGVSPEGLLHGTDALADVRPPGMGVPVRIGGNGPDDLWVNDDAGLLWRRSGTVWSQTPLSEVPFAIEGAGDGQVWVATSSLLLLWTGTAWRVSDACDGCVPAYVAFAAAGSDRAWALREYVDWGTRVGSAHDVLRRWDGESWSEGPQRSGGGYHTIGLKLLRDLAPAGAGVIAVGQEGIVARTVDDAWAFEGADEANISAIWSASADGIYTGHPGRYEFTSYRGPQLAVSGWGGASFWGSSADDVWMGGRLDGELFLRRWDGTRFEELPISGLTQIVAGHASGPDDAWIAGGDRMAHWDGERFTLHDLPPGFVARAVGPAGLVAGNGIARWNGEGFAVEVEPAADRHLRTIAASGHRAWAAGTHLLRFDGERWHQSQAPAYACWSVAVVGPNRTQVGCANAGVLDRGRGFELLPRAPPVAAIGGLPPFVRAAGRSILRSCTP